MVDFDKLAGQAKEIASKVDGDELKEAASEIKQIVTGDGSVADKAKEAVEVVKGALDGPEDSAGSAK